MTVTVEPDRDGDGYGDLTQDRCPGGASFGSDCPITIKITSTTRQAANAILIQVKPQRRSSARSLRAGQLAGIGERKTAPGKLDGSLTAGLSAGAGALVPGGSTASFRLPLPKPVLNRLSHLAAHATSLLAQPDDPLHRRTAALSPQCRAQSQLRGRKRPAHRQ